MAIDAHTDTCDHMVGGCHHNDDGTGYSWCDDCGKRWPFRTCGMTDSDLVAAEIEHGMAESFANPDAE